MEPIISKSIGDIAPQRYLVRKDGVSMGDSLEAIFSARIFVLVRVEFESQLPVCGPTIVSADRDKNHEVFRSRV
jgi:hypothetical protein